MVLKSSTPGNSDIGLHNWPGPSLHHIHRKINVFPGTARIPRSAQTHTTVTAKNQFHSILQSTKLLCLLHISTWIPVLSSAFGHNLKSVEVIFTVDTATTCQTTVEELLPEGSLHAAGQVLHLTQLFQLCQCLNTTNFILSIQTRQLTQSGM